jgi:hypothetical protein
MAPTVLGQNDVRQEIACKNLIATMEMVSSTATCFRAKQWLLRQHIRAGHIPSSHRKSIIDFIPQLIDFGITINLTLEFIPTS